MDNNRSHINFDDKSVMAALIPTIQQNYHNCQTTHLLRILNVDRANYNIFKLTLIKTRVHNRMNEKTLVSLLQLEQQLSYVMHQIINFSEGSVLVRISYCMHGLEWLRGLNQYSANNRSVAREKPITDLLYEGWAYLPLTI